MARLLLGRPRRARGAYRACPRPGRVPQRAGGLGSASARDLRARRRCRNRNERRHRAFFAPITLPSFPRGSHGGPRARVGAIRRCVTWALPRGDRRHRERSRAGGFFAPALRRFSRWRGRAAWRCSRRLRCERRSARLGQSPRLAWRYPGASAVASRSRLQRPLPVHGSERLGHRGSLSGRFLNGPCTLHARRSGLPGRSGFLRRGASVRPTLRVLAGAHGIRNARRVPGSRQATILAQWMTHRVQRNSHGKRNAEAHEGAPASCRRRLAQNLAVPSSTLASPTCSASTCVEPPLMT